MEITIMHDGLLRIALTLLIVTLAFCGTTSADASGGEKDENHDKAAAATAYSDYVTGAPAAASDAWTISAGGRLYDNWMEALGRKAPAGNHPLWPASNTAQKGATTWRCKSCHGWDYKGAKGAYSTGPYATGIGGVDGVSGRAPSEIVKLFTDTRHGFTEAILPTADKMRLAAFLAAGQHDAARFIAADGNVRGDAGRGKAIFETTCAACHGYDGRTLNWGSRDKPAYVGTEARAAPPEVLHKIRNGHPGHNMISLQAFSLEDAANVLAYARTLPEK